MVNIPVSKNPFIPGKYRGVHAANSKQHANSANAVIISNNLIFNLDCINKCSFQVVKILTY